MNIYLIQTDSRYLLEHKIATITKKSSNCLTYVYDKNIKEILEEASYVSLFDETKYVIVKNANFFGKEKLTEKDEQELEKYILSPYKKTVLIFVTYEEVDKRKKITKLINENYTFLTLESPKGYELSNEIKKELSIYKVSDAAIKYLLEASLNQYDLIQNEIAKFSLYFQKNDTISLNQMKEIVASNVNENLFKFTDAVITRNMKETFKLLKDFLSVKTDASQLSNLLLREFRLLLYYKLLEKKQYSFNEIAKKLSLRDWQVTKIMKNASNFHIDDLKDYIISFAHMDYKIKSGSWDKVMGLYTFLINYFA